MTMNKIFITKKNIEPIKVQYFLINQYKLQTLRVLIQKDKGENHE